MLLKTDFSPASRQCAEAYETPRVRIIIPGLVMGMCQTASPNNYSIPNVFEVEEDW